MQSFAPCNWHQPREKCERAPFRRGKIETIISLATEKLAASRVAVAKLPCERSEVIGRELFVNLFILLDFGSQNIINISRSGG